METNTTTVRNRRFTVNGQEFTVWETRTVGRNVTGFAGLGRTVRTFVTDANGTEVAECEPGCSFQAERVTRQAVA